MALTKEQAEFADLVFPPNFAFGAASSSFQAEGAVQDGGRGLSIWDAFSHFPGAIKDDSTADVAVDSYHRWAEDVDLMTEMGLGAMRFSLSWSRIMPEGTGEVNQAGLDYYDQLVDAMCEAGIDPTAVLFHWDYPQALQARGGWMNQDAPSWFGEYAGVVAKRLGDRVTSWIPIAQPNAYVLYGYAVGINAPAHCMGINALEIGHGVAMGHGYGVQALRANCKGLVGCDNGHMPGIPASQTIPDLKACSSYDAVVNYLFPSAMLQGRYPEVISAMLPAHIVESAPIACQPLDFYGISYFRPTLVGTPASVSELTGVFNPHIPPTFPFNVARVINENTLPWGAVDDAQTLLNLIHSLYLRYGTNLPPLVVSANGLWTPSQEGVPDTKDEERIAYLYNHLHAISQALQEGADIRGYFYWSLTDLWEWAAGYTQSYGLVGINHETLERFPRDSYYWYQALIDKFRGY